MRKLSVATESANTYPCLSSIYVKGKTSSYYGNKHKKSAAMEIYPLGVHLDSYFGDSILGDDQYADLHSL